MNTRLICLSVLSVLSAASAHAQLSVSWFSIDCGGGITAGGSLDVRSAIGQYDAGQTLVGGSLSITSGYLFSAGSAPIACDSIDFNNNGVFPEDQDVVDFFDVLAGGQPETCDQTLGCNDLDFNNNGVFPEDQDVVDFFNVLAGGTCP